MFSRFAIVFAASLGIDSVSAPRVNAPIPSGIPRLPDGKPDLNAAAPRLPDGSPDFSGVWSQVRTLEFPTPEMFPWADKVTRIGFRAHCAQSGHWKLARAWLRRELRR
jgi:hypothetical protein